MEEVNKVEDLASMNEHRSTWRGREVDSADQMSLESGGRTAQQQLGQPYPTCAFINIFSPV